MKKTTLYFFFLAIPLFSFTMHKYYISLTQVNYIQEEKSLQITTRIFIDDLEFAIQKETNQNLELNTSIESKNSDDIITNYISERFKIKINDTFYTFKYLGKEYEEDLIYCYLEVQNIDEINSIKISNTVLFEVFNEQQNIVKLNINNSNKTFYFTKKNNKGLLKF